jgi:hypothetical protein
MIAKVRRRDTSSAGAAGVVELEVASVMARGR